MAIGRERLEEEHAVSRLKGGDIGGLEYLVHRYQVQAMRAADLITRDRAAAEDIVQAAFLRAYQRIGQFDAARPFGPWFLRSVINDAIKFASRRQRTVSFENDGEEESGIDMLPDPSAADPLHRLEQAETAQAMWEALGQLSPAQRATVVSRYYLEMSEAETAGRLGCAVGTVKWRLHVARERLRVLLSQSLEIEQPHARDEGERAGGSHAGGAQLAQRKPIR